MCGTISRFGALPVLAFAAGMSLANAPDDRLHRAAFENDLAAARMLGESGADFAPADAERGGDGDGGAALLKYAEEHGESREAVRNILLLGYPYRLLEASVVNDNVDLTAPLLALRGEVDGDDVRSDVELLRIAAARGSAGVAQLLLERGGVDVRSDRSWLDLAAKGGSAEVARLLLDAGAPMSARVFDGRTPLHTAARSRTPDVAGLLLERGAGIDATDDFGWTPLHVALYGNAEGHPVETAMALVEWGASVDAETFVMGWRPLHLAAWLGNPGMVRTLLDRGADVNAPMKFGGWTPLHLASRRPEAEEVIALLRDAGAVDGGAGERVRLVRYGRAEAEASLIKQVEPSELAATRFYQREVLRGAFTAAGADERLVRMSVGEVPNLQDFGELHALIDSAGDTHFLWLADSGRFELWGSCRDSQSGRDQLIYRFSPDGTCCRPHKVYMYWDDSAGGLAEGFDDYWYPGILAYPPVDGRCRWREAKAQAEASARAFAALRVGVPGEWEASEVPTVLAHVEIRKEVVEEQLALLRANGAAEVVDALAPDTWDEPPAAGSGDVVAGPERWEVIHATLSGAEHYFGGKSGVTLVRDRHSGGWRSVLDCEYVEFHGLEQDTLYLSVPVKCSKDNHHEHDVKLDIKLDLLSLKTELVEDYEDWERIIQRLEVYW